MIFLLIVLAIILGVGGGIWYLTRNNYKDKGSKSDINESITYVSKYGFSVSYPNNWYLEEKRGIRLAEWEKLGYIPFTIYDYDPSNPDKSANSKGIGVEFNFYRDAERYLKDKGLAIPNGYMEKIVFLADKYNIYKKDPKDSIKYLNINGIEMVLIYYEGKDPWQALYYLPKQDTLAIISISSTRYSEELIPILKTIKLRNEE